MKQILSALILIAALVSLGIGGTLAAWVESDRGDFTLEAGEWHVDQSGTIGFWRESGALNAFGETDLESQEQIELWLVEIDDDSCWLGPTTYADMVVLLSYGEEGVASIMEQKFLAHYLAQRLNQISGWQSENTEHYVSDVPSYDDYGNYLNLPDPAYGYEIIQQIEGKCDADELTNPDADEFEIMKDVCDYLNNLDI